MIESFLSPYEEELQEELLTKGYIIHDIEEREALEHLRHQMVVLACEHLGVALPEDDALFLNNLHKNLPAEKINPLRMHVYSQLNTHSWLRPSYHAFGKKPLGALVGSELAMQNRVNLSIQMPGDSSSVLAGHLDTFSGETPFQVVQWLPIVDVYESKSMFILPPEKNRQLVPKMKSLLESGGTDAVLDHVKSDLVWPEIKFGQVMIFSPTLLHGNVLNETDETRWSMNSRFTGLFSPYSSGEKGLGTFYLPITTKPISRVGMAYSAPSDLAGK